MPDMRVRHFSFIALALVLGISSCGGNHEPDPGPLPPEVPARTPGKDMFYKGTTMCFASYMQDVGLKYREGGKETDPYVSVARHGANCVRLQLDHVPFERYNGVNIDWQTWNRVLADAKKAGGKMLADCDAAIVTVGDSAKADTWIEDCSIAMSFMMLAAVDQGIGSCWVQIYLRKQEDGSDAEDAVREILSLKETDRIAGILALGVPAKEAEPHTEADADMGKVIRIG